MATIQKVVLAMLAAVLTARGEISCRRVYDSAKNRSAVENTRKLSFEAWRDLDRSFDSIIDGFFAGLESAMWLAPDDKKAQAALIVSKYQKANWMNDRRAIAVSFVAFVKEKSVPIEDVGDYNASGLIMAWFLEKCDGSDERAKEISKSLLTATIKSAKLQKEMLEHIRSKESK